MKGNDGNIGTVIVWVNGREFSATRFEGDTRTTIDADLSPYGLPNVVFEIEVRLDKEDAVE